MRLWPVVLLSLAFLSGCGGGSSDSRAQAHEEVASRPAKKSKLNRFDSKWTDEPSNRKTGDKLPTQGDATLVGPDGKPVSLASYEGKPLVLVVMRGFAGFICPFCATQTAQLATRYGELTAAGAEVVIVYPTKDEQQSKIDEFVAAVNAALAEEGEESIPFKVLLDPGVKLVKKYNLEGIDLSRPSTFVLDVEGVVAYAYVGKKIYDRPTVDRILNEVKALGAR